MKRIMVIGSLNMDLVTKVDKTPLVGQTVFGEGLVKYEGGKGANQAVAIGKLGGNVTMLGMLGNDPFADTLKNNLKKHNVDTKYLFSTTKAPTGTALIMVNENGDNSIVVIPGANNELSEQSIETEFFKDIDYVLAQFEVPKKTITKAFKIAKNLGIKTVLNPAPASTIDEELLSLCDMLIPNETEFELITGCNARDKESIIHGASVLFDKGVNEVLVTLGENGAIYLNSDGKICEVDAYEVKAIDTTAAGDSFIGGLLTCLSNKKTIEEALEYAMKVGALTVSKQGAQSSLPQMDEVEQFEGVKKNEKR